MSKRDRTLRLQYDHIQVFIKRTVDFFFTKSYSNNVFLSVWLRQLITYAKCCAFNFFVSGIMSVRVASRSLKFRWEMATKMVDNYILSDIEC